ncbi:MAG: caspase family protein [Phycisphaerae bacterium]|nr:caspase family protein [Saprospiraceae bacterium]
MKHLPLFFACLLSLSLAAQQNGEDYAVFFVVTDFDYWPDLKGIDKDPRDIASELENNYGFKKPGFYLNPTKAEILSVLNEYQGRNFGANDQLFVFCSMHGIYDEAIGALVPKDGLLEDPGYETWLLHPALEAMLTKIKCPHILLALDACYSGTFGQKDKGRPDASAWETDASDCIAKRKQALRLKSRLYLTSGGKERTPAQSQFARKMLEALRVRNTEGLLNYPKLYSVLSEAFPKPMFGDFRNNEVGGDFVFVKKNGCVTAFAATEKSDGANAALERDLAAWKKALTFNSCAGYSEYQSAFCPGGSFCEAIEPKMAVIQCGKNSAPLKPSDVDADGVPDNQDQCPNEKGTIDNNGCPVKTSIEGKDATYFFDSGLRKLQLKDTVGSIADFKKSYELGCKDLDQSKLLGDIAYSSKDYCNAAYFREQYQKLLTTPSSSVELYSLGIAHYFCKDDPARYDKAERAFLQVTQLSPQAGVGWLWTAKAASKKDPTPDEISAKPELSSQYGQARSYYEKYVSIAEDNPEKNKKDLINAYSYLAYCYFVKEDRPNFDNTIAKWQTLDPNNTTIKDMKEAFGKN